VTWRALLLAALVSACGVLPGPVDTARLPPGEFASGDRDVAAVNYAAAAFSDQSSTYGNPAGGAEAALAMEYISGELNTSPRWVGMNTDTKDGLLRGREELRATLGIAPDASSQTVVNALSAAKQALQAGDKAAAAAALRNPAFTFSPEKTIEVLGNLPYMQPVNAATLQAAEAVSGVEPAPPLTSGLTSY
jgi:hypothetical protein